MTNKRNPFRKKMKGLSSSSKLKRLRAQSFAMHRRAKSQAEFEKTIKEEWVPPKFQHNRKDVEKVVFNKGKANEKVLFDNQKKDA